MQTLGRWCAVVLPVVLLGFAASSRADDEADVRAIIDKGIKALGGEANIKKYPAVSWKESGKYYAKGVGVKYTGSMSTQRPDKVRVEIDGELIIVVNGDKGWIRTQGMTTELDDDQLSDYQEMLHADSVTSLVPLKETGFKLAALPEIKVNDRAAVGVKVEHKYKRDMNLFFDKETGLLVKSVQRVKSEDQFGDEVTQEIDYGEYKDVKGVKIATKLTQKHDGKLHVESEVSDVKLSEKLADKVFAKP